jgi:hypothetical protein
VSLSIGKWHSDPHSVTRVVALSRFYGKADQNLRFSSQWPDWPISTKGTSNYAQIYNASSPNAYSWQFSDLSATFKCPGSASGPNYQVTFCPSS